MEKGLQLSELQRYEMNVVGCEGSHMYAAGAACCQQNRFFLAIADTGTSKAFMLVNIHGLIYKAERNMTYLQYVRAEDMGKENNNYEISSYRPHRDAGYLTRLSCARSSATCVDINRAFLSKCLSNNMQQISVGTVHTGN